MSRELMHQIVETIEAEARSRPSPIEFEMAYQVRIAIERIRFAIRHVEQYSSSRDQIRDACMQLLDALDRLQSSDRHFQTRSRGAQDVAGSEPEAAHACAKGNTHD